MFDEIPIRVWLLVAIAATAFVPARYLYRYMLHAPNRRDITLPSEDLSWRTSDLLIRNAALVVALAGLAIFIFTPSAEKFAQSPAFFPLLMLCFSAFAFFTVIGGFVKGRIEPLSKGSLGPYSRDTQPMRFWASLVWNSIWGLVGIWAALIMMAEEQGKKCYYTQRSDLQERLAACDALIAKADNSKAEQGGFLGTRALIHHRLGDYEKALADYDRAIALDPKDSYSLYHRGILYEDIDDAGSAILAYTESLELRPDNPAPYFRRGAIYLDRGRFDEAVSDFTHAHDLQPADPWPIAARGYAYAWKKDQRLAQRDFDEVRNVDPSNPVLLRGEALLSMNAGDMPAAVARLTEALRRYPKDAWLFNMRAEAYRRSGEMGKAAADSVRLRQLSSDANEAEVGGY